MNKFKFYFILLLAGISFVSCSKKDDDEVVTVPLRDYEVQYKADNDSIEKYLKTHYIKEVTANFDITFEKIPANGTQISIMDQKDYELATRSVYNRGVNYKVRYLILNKGTGLSPCNTDRVNAAYSGNLLDGTVFDNSYGIGRSFELYVYVNSPVIDGWGEIFPQFKTGTSKTSDNGTVTYENFGAGVMFLPSGLGYYANTQTNIPAYSPLIFSFKLFDLQRLDHEYTFSNGSAVNVGDGIPDYKEDLDGDGYLYDLRDTARFPNPPDSYKVNYDTDGDGIPDFLDLDDDGDGYSTRFEVTKPVDAPVTGVSLIYPWDPIADNPATPNTNESETFGIPRRPTGALTDPSKPESIDNPRKFVDDDYKVNPRLRIHLDKTYPYQKK
ncbi:FKBP-type peptidyl-prolyl isomerase-like protein [Flavobacterium sp. 9]|uniref:FKBP-type peptidyl-prolyl cis-trans isomerase n=1 Tax=Flavobacterium sp. 9 TaxID=2035198 RepID=UPI000C1750B6|nr:FKBP-type peptidyl-prolyl cis-trans isomerase [Flavobacterium sp. 9]PIF31100.1 FKBP-type peptidyl-prolyl isomerase-like protein [Flavobacterium sp. 9]